MSELNEVVKKDNWKIMNYGEPNVKVYQLKWKRSDLPNFDKASAELMRLYVNLNRARRIIENAKEINDDTTGNGYGAWTNNSPLAIDIDAWLKETL